MTTDTQLAPTDTEIADLWHNSRSNRFEVISFARAALARWGQPAHSGEPMAFIHWPVSGPPRLVWHSQKALNDAILKGYKGYQPDEKLYTAPQPVEREPLTPEQVVDAFCKQPHTVQFVEAFIKGVRFAEQYHGIKGGQHGTE